MASNRLYPLRSRYLTPGVQIVLGNPGPLKLHDFPALPLHLDAHNSMSGIFHPVRWIRTLDQTHARGSPTRGRCLSIRLPLPEGGQRIAAASRSPFGH